MSMYIPKKYEGSVIIAPPNGFGVSLSALLGRLLPDPVNFVVSFPETIPSNFVRLVHTVGAWALENVKRMQASDRLPDYISRIGSTLRKEFIFDDKKNVGENFVDVNHVYVLEPVDVQASHAWIDAFFTLFNVMKAFKDRFLYFQLIDYHTQTLGMVRYFPLFLRPLLFSSPYLIAKAISGELSGEEEVSRSVKDLVKLVGLVSRDPEIFNYENPEEVMNLFESVVFPFEVALRKEKDLPVFIREFSQKTDIFNYLVTLPYSGEVKPADVRVYPYFVVAEAPLGQWSVKELERAMIQHNAPYGVGYVIRGSEAIIYVLKLWTRRLFPPLTKIVGEAGLEGSEGMVFTKVMADNVGEKIKEIVDVVRSKLVRFAPLGGDSEMLGL